MTCIGSQHHRKKIIYIMTINEVMCQRFEVYLRVSVKYVIFNPFSGVVSLT